MADVNPGLLSPARQMPSQGENLQRKRASKRFRCASVAAVQMGPHGEAHSKARGFPRPHSSARGSSAGPSDRIVRAAIHRSKRLTKRAKKANDLLGQLVPMLLDSFEQWQ